jgi:integrator complex subunit 9
MKAMYCPIDTSLNFTQANKLIRELKPQHLVIPGQYMSPPLLHPTRQDLVIDVDPPPISFKQGDIVTLPTKRHYEKIELDLELAGSLCPSEVRPGISVATVTGQLLGKNNKYVLKGIEKSSDKMQPPPPKRSKVDNDMGQPTFYTWGSPDLYEFVKTLEKKGIKDIKKEETSDGFIVHLQSEDTLIQVEDTLTHIICKDERLRCLLRDSMVDCLNKF